MASSSWSTLPTLILSTLSNLLNTDVDNLRLRSVCSSWRSSVPPRLKPSPFPLKVPQLLNCNTHAHSTGGNYYLNYTTIYRLSPPEYGPRAGDPSDGWLFRVSELSPNRFALLSLAAPIGAKYARLSMPKLLNLLHYRITEISKCYCLTFVDSEGFVTDTLDPRVVKVSVLSNDCDFAVFALFMAGNAICWKYGEKNWVPLSLGFADMVVSDGKCYGTDGKGKLFYYECDLKPVEARVAPLPRRSRETTNDLLHYKSDLYVVLKTLEISFDFDDESDEPPGIPLRLEVFKKCKSKWEKVGCLTDEAIIVCEDASFVVRLEDFKYFKGNCVHVTMRSSLTCSDSGENVCYYGVYDFAEPETANLKRVLGSQLMLWPPPSWLLSG